VARINKGGMGTNTGVWSHSYFSLFAFKSHLFEITTGYLLSIHLSKRQGVKNERKVSDKGSIYKLNFG